MLVASISVLALGGGLAAGGWFALKATKARQTVAAPGPEKGTAPTAEKPEMATVPTSPAPAGGSGHTTPPALEEITLSIVTQPLGATYKALWQGGQATGITPASVKVKAGTHVELSFVKDGHKPAAQSLTARESGLVTVPLEALPRKVEPPPKPKKKTPTRVGDGTMDVDL